MKKIDSNCYNIRYRVKTSVASHTVCLGQNELLMVLGLNCLSLSIPDEWTLHGNYILTIYSHVLEDRCNKTYDTFICLATDESNNYNRKSADSERHSHWTLRKKVFRCY